MNSKFGLALVGYLRVYIDWVLQVVTNNFKKILKIQLAECKLWLQCSSKQYNSTAIWKTSYLFYNIQSLLRIEFFIIRSLPFDLGFLARPSYRVETKVLLFRSTRALATCTYPQYGFFIKLKFHRINAKELKKRSTNFRIITI